VRPEGEEFMGPQDMAAACEQGATVELLEEHESACFARLRMPRHQGQPVDHTRTVIFGKGAPLIAIWDEARVAPEAESAFRMAPVFHVQKTVASGQGWFDTARDTAMGTITCSWDNAPARLLIAFPLPAGEVCTASPRLADGCWDGYYEPAWVPEYMAWRIQHDCVYQAAVAAPGRSKGFLTLLVPHAPERDGGELADGVRVISSSETGCCVQAEGFTLALGEAGCANELVETDASLLLVEQADGRRRVSYCGASRIVLEGESVLSKSERSSGELVL